MSDQPTTYHVNILSKESLDFLKQYAAHIDSIGMAVWENGKSALLVGYFDYMLPHKELKFKFLT